MNCYRSDDVRVGVMMSTVKCAIQNYILTRNGTTIKSVSFAPYSANVKAQKSLQTNGTEDLARQRSLLGVSESIMIKVSIAVESRTVYAVLDQKIFNESVSSGIMERSLRRVSLQSTTHELDWLRVCRSLSPTVCMSEEWTNPPRGQQGNSYARLDQCSMTSSEWDRLYERQGN